MARAARSRGAPLPLLLLGAPPPSSKPRPPAAKNVVRVRCSDGEIFPVKRKLLRPCISLAAVVCRGLGKYRDEGSGDGEGGDVDRNDSDEVGELDEDLDDDLDDERFDCTVDEDCLCFDRVLLYLEAEARGEGETHVYDLQYTSELFSASQRLGIAGLESLCRKHMGAFEARVRKTPISLAEVRRRNSP